MAKKAVKALVVTGYGTNCEREMAHCCKLGGAGQVDIVHWSDILDGTYRIQDYHFLNLPGGFLDGDHLGSAQAAAHRLLHAHVANTGERLLHQILNFIAQGGVILGVCNGFQLLVKAGILPGLEGNYTQRIVSLTHNDSGRFEDRWVTLGINANSPCIFTRGIQTMDLPVRHGEGKFVTMNEGTLKAILDQNLMVMQYLHAETGMPTQEYPHNPNGSEMAIAGICDSTGRIFGLMPHPEAYHHRTNHPLWTRKELPEEGMGLALFRNAVNYIQTNVL